MKLVMLASSLASMLGAVSIAASRDTTRPHLNSVLIDVADGAIVATDGHRLAIGELPDYDGIEVSPMARALIPLDDVDRVVKLLKRAHGGCEVSISESTVAFSCNGSTIGARAVDAAFPPYREVLPSASPEVAPAPDCGAGIGVNGKYLADCARGFSMLGSRNEGIVIHPRPAPLDPIRVTCDSAPLTWVVMPMRLAGATCAYVPPRYAESSVDRSARLARMAEEQRARDEAAALALIATFALPDAAE